MQTKKRTNTQTNKMNIKRTLLLLALSLSLSLSFAQNLQKGDYGYLYCHMADNGEWTAYALSRDGIHYHDLLDGNAVMDPAVTSPIEGGARDAYICRKSDDDKGYLMVTTDMCNRISKCWWNYGINLMKSDDLIHWTTTTFDFRKGPEIFCDPESPDPVTKSGAAWDWKKINRVWAPQVFWDPSYKWKDGTKGGYFVYYSIWSTNEDDGYDRMVYSYADRSFTKLTKPRVLFDWGYATIDADINYLESDHKYHMLIKKEGGHPGIFHTKAKSLLGPWPEPDEGDFVNFEGNKKCEGASAFQLIGDDEWRVAYVQYSDRPHKYRICKADKYLKKYYDTEDIQGVKHPQHGSFMRLAKEEYDRLEAWGNRNHQTSIINHNPVINGLYGDPYIMWSEKNQKYYIYPTTDGFRGWDTRDMNCFSSTDLQNWKSEGKIIESGKNTASFAEHNFWAPTCIEKKIVTKKKVGKKTVEDVSYKYYFYYSADKQIAVAVADDPAGPFITIDTPVVGVERPLGFKRGQNIDPDVFHDPVSGKYYLYWGNYYMVGAELSDDMLSIKPETMFTLIDSNEFYSEGTHVFYRDGKYYFMWSKNDVRTPDYQVRYISSDSPTKKLDPSKCKIILQKDSARGIYCTGHHSTICIPGTDEWYIVYHRFRYPDAIEKGKDAGWTREVCIDRMLFDENGEILPVRPTHVNEGRVHRVSNNIPNYSHFNLHSPFPTKVAMAGDYADPSIMRDGKDFYMTHSPMNYSPGLLIWHSTDFVNWEPIARPLIQPKDALWAPEILKHDGKFYIYYPSARKENYVIWANDIRGPWSEPILTGVKGIDPGHVVTADGTRYLYTDKGAVTKLTDDGFHADGVADTVYAGWQFPRTWKTEGRNMYLESPKIVKRGDYYYLVSAEGGTAGPATSHMAVVARSKSALGPWENSPYNPLVHTWDTNDQWWSRGHGTLIDDAEGNWWFVYHAYLKDMHTLGRHTLVDPIEWTEDGWPVLGELREKGEKSNVMNAPNLSCDFTTFDVSKNEAFGVLPWQFTFWAEYTPDAIGYGKQGMTVLAKGDSIPAARLLQTTAMDSCYVVETEITSVKNATAGLLLYYKQNSFAGITFDGKLLTTYRSPPESTTIKVKQKSICLRITNRKNICLLEYSTDGKIWNQLASNVDVSSFNHNNYRSFLALRPTLISWGKGAITYKYFRYESK
mgnify:CR=1 FL=1